MGSIIEEKDKDAPTSTHENAWYNQDFNGYRVSEQPLFTRRPVRLICVGAGAAGLQIAYKAERTLQDVQIQIYEKNEEVGGTWLENRYPGCACDIPSHSYQFSWARNPNWSQFYAPSLEIWDYFKDVATKYDLEKYVKFGHRVKSAVWNEADGIWSVLIQTPDGSVIEDYCEILANGCGGLNSWKYPNIPGLDTFKGELMHSANWNKSTDLSGKTVAVIGGGSSAVQVITAIQPIVKKLVPFLRSPVWISTGFGGEYAGPGGTNFHYSDEQKETFRSDPVAYREYCSGIEREINKRFNLMHRDSDLQKEFRHQIELQMRAQLKDKPRLAEHLIPKFSFGCRRVIPGPGYLESLIQPNVEPVTESAIRITEKGVVDESGIEHEVDVVVCATGFDIKGVPLFNVIGRRSTTIKDEFGDLPKAYLGAMAPGFPNLFLITGPNGPGSHGSILSVMEWHIRYMFHMIKKMQEENIKSYEPKQEVVDELYDHTHECMKRFVWSSSCRSWFKAGKSEGPVIAIWPGSRLHLLETLREVRYEDYKITYRSGNRFQYLGNGFTHRELDPKADAAWYFNDPFVKV